MSTIHDRIPHTLGAGDVGRIEDAGGTLVTSLSGVLWVTQLGDERDHILVKGQSIVLEGEGSALVSSLDGPAVVRASAPAALLEAA